MIIKKVFLHQLSDAKELFEVVANERQILPILVEKDYWIMHCLWGLQQQGFQFALKGGRIVDTIALEWVIELKAMQSVTLLTI